MEPTFFYQPEEEAGCFRATAWTRGPWSLDHQHGGPPAALLARAVEKTLSRQDFAVVRFTVDFLRPIPIDRVCVEVEPIKLGRTVECHTARLWRGNTLLLVARTLALRRCKQVLTEPIELPVAVPAPETVKSYVFPFFLDPVGYQAAVDVRYVRGSWGQQEATCWLRQRCPLLVGEKPTSLQRILIAADAGHGLAVPVDPKSHTFLNADLSVHLVRPLCGEWVGMRSQSVANPSGVGLCQTELGDTLGPVGQGVQSLVIRRR